MQVLEKPRAAQDDVYSSWDVGADIASELEETLAAAGDERSARPDVVEQASPAPKFRGCE